MTDQEIREFLDHIRETCMADRQHWKERARNAEGMFRRLVDECLEIDSYLCKLPEKALPASVYNIWREVLSEACLALEIDGSSDG